LCVGATIAAGAAVPLETWLGGWRWSLAFWLLPVLATMLVWLRHTPKSQPGSVEESPPLPRLRNNRLAWQVTLLMGLQSSIAYCVFGWLRGILVYRRMALLAACFALSIAMAVTMFSAPLAACPARRGKDKRAALRSLLSLTFLG